MTDYRAQLRADDPARHAEMSAADVARIRCRVVSAAADANRLARFVWPRSFVLTTAALSVTCTLALVALQQSVLELRRKIGGSDRPALSDTAAVNEAPPVQKQQLQFATPGGTRIIWVFDAEFEVKGTLP